MRSKIGWTKNDKSCNGSLIILGDKIEKILKGSRIHLPCLFKYLNV